MQRYTYRVLQTIQMKLILLWVRAEQAVLGRAKTALKFFRKDFYLLLLREIQTDQKLVFIFHDCHIFLALLVK